MIVIFLESRIRGKLISGNELELRKVIRKRYKIQRDDLINLFTLIFDIPEKIYGSKAFKKEPITSSLILLFSYFPEY